MITLVFGENRHIKINLMKRCHIRTKVILVTQCFNQQEGIDYYQTFAPIAWLEDIRTLLDVLLL